MSGKIRSKDLSYDAALPPFLQRLRDQNAGRGDTDRHERAIARPKLGKSAADDDEDGPTVVDESGEAMTHKDFEQRRAAESAKTTQDESEPADVEAVKEPRTQQRVTNGALSMKRKAGKVIADEAGSTEDTANKPVKKAKKKAKPIKLAFDDNDED